MSAQIENQSHGFWRTSEALEVVTFNLQEEVFALEAEMVQEIVDLLPETDVPGADAFVGGVVNFRGKVIPLADIRQAFGMEAAEVTIDSRIVVIEMLVGGEPTLVGLKTDKVHEVTTLVREASEPPPRIGMSWKPEFIRCVVRRDGDFVVVPDLQSILVKSTLS